MTDPAASTATLHLLTGPWATGKTTLVPHLSRLLPDLVVFDWDVLLPGLSAAVGKDARHESSTWDGLRAMWVAVVGSVLGGGRDVLLCGPASPPGFTEGSLAPYPVRCAYLDCPDEVLARRLRARGATEAEMADELAMLAGLRESHYHRVHAGSSAGGSAVSCPRRFANSFLTTSGSETTSAGRSSTAERRPPARGCPTNRCS